MSRLKTRILVFPGGTEIGLEIHRALKDCKDIELYSCNSGVSNHASYVYQNNCIIPSVKNKRWVSSLNKVATNKKIDYIYPAHDEVLLALSQNRDKIKTEIIVPSVKTCAIARSKSKTYSTLQKIIPTPSFINDLKKVQWPVFLKPDKGQGSQNTFLVKNRKEYDFYMGMAKDMLALEYLPGREYTVDCFSSQNSDILFCGGRQRLRIRNGISVNSKIVKNPIFNEYAKKISSTLKMQGAWFFQLKEAKNGALKLLEVAPRISGTMSLYRVLGINFPLLSIYQKAGIKFELLTNKYNIEVDRALRSRYKHNLYYDFVYIDFDDTIIFDNRINVDIMKFIYQCRNNGKKIILLTRTKRDLKIALSKYGISEKLFSKIFKMKKGEAKYKYIKNMPSIFIDDSFSERQEVAKKSKIPTFDLSMLELLMEQ